MAEKWESVGESIRKFREESGWEAEDFYRSIGFSAKEGLKVESGKRFPFLLMLTRICQVYSVQPERFFNVDLEKEIGGILPPEVAREIGPEKGVRLLFAIESCSEKTKEMLAEIIQLIEAEARDTEET